MADLLAEIGLEATFFARVNSDEMYLKLLDRDMEFVWKPGFVSRLNESSNENAQLDTDGKKIFAHLMYDHYTPPWFILTDYVKKDLINNYDHNDDENWFTFIDGQIDSYRTRNALVMWGDDFSHINASTSLLMAEHIIRGLNRSSRNLGKYRVKFSTMEQYLESVYS